MTDDEFLSMLTRHEGKRNTVYSDSRGYLTIGVGFLVDSRIKGSGLSDKEIAAVLRIRVQSVVDTLDSREPWWRKLSPNRQAVLVDMAYNLGEAHLEEFKNTLSFMQQGQYAKAADGMLASLWAKQVGNRAKELADIMRTDVYNGST